MLRSRTVPRASPASSFDEGGTSGSNNNSRQRPTRSPARRKRKSGDSRARLVFATVGVAIVSATLLCVIWTVGSFTSGDNNNNSAGQHGLFPGMKRAAASLTLRRKSSSNNGGKKPKPPLNEGFCRYDGHCPVGTSCAVVGPNTKAAADGEIGFCEPIVSKGSQQTGDTSACVEACRSELEVDEHFYQEKWPVVEWTESPVTSKGRPGGCLLVYHREPEGDSHWRHLAAQDAAVKWNDVSPSVRNWTETRFRHVIRVDPYKPHDLNDNKWMAYCYAPCRVDSDCSTPNDPVGGEYPFLCKAGACQRNNAKYWQADLDGKHSELVLATGATEGFKRGLFNFLASAKYWAPRHKVVVFNLGDMSADTKKIVKENYDNVLALEWEDGIPKHYPKHLARGKEYAWKPVVINETVHKYKMMFWLDAGATFVGPVDPLVEVVQRYGAFLVKGQDENMAGKSHPKTYEMLGTKKEGFEGGPHFAGGIQGHVYPSRYIDPVVRENTVCALNHACIAPSGASLSNHRYDQTTLTILSYGAKQKLPHFTEYVAASINQLNRDLAKPSFKFIWTARQSCQFYTNLMAKR